MAYDSGGDCVDLTIILDGESGGDGSVDSLTTRLYWL